MQGQNQLSDKFGEVIYREWKQHGRAYNEAELNQLLDETQADALITEHDHVTSEVINAHPHLRFIGVCRGTPSNVDLEAAKVLGIPVFHTPARNAQAVAEMFVANVINLMRNTIASWQWLTGKNWGEGTHTSYLQFKGNELAGKTIGMVGFGAVGQRIAKIVTCFPCHIQFYDPYIEKGWDDYQKISLAGIFESSDIVSIHLPVNEQTIGMIDKSLISKMKPSAIFVNTARASVVKRDDLLYAIENNKIRGAVLDVFDFEPPDDKDYRFINHPNVLATPHTAGATHEVEDHHVDILNSRIFKWAAELEAQKNIA
ncbi:MAG: D-isomer specific 2-hydroxyacid dehydrogenase NAD-binding [Mucilaginibacter sp.]|nr:D-isomer specific 2-hydroxyacid dehydrogenase NAD-binding [Mucilaginibacter sp.]